jgi:hypothetical protein
LNINKTQLNLPIPLSKPMPISLLERIPKRKYSKKEICQLLADPENFINGNIAAINTSKRANEQLKRDVLRSGLLQQFGITVTEYDCIRVFTVTQGELILNKLM